MRRYFAFAMLAVVTGCSGSGGQAQSSPPSRTEETAAAELLFSLTDHGVSDQAWILQTSTSPAIFEIHGLRGNITATVSKKDKCKYSTDLASTAPDETFTVHYEADLAGMNPDGFTVNGVNRLQRLLTGSAVSCTLVSGSPDICKQFGEGVTPALMGGPLPWVKQLGTEFKAKYCQ